MKIGYFQMKMHYKWSFLNQNSPFLSDFAIFTTDFRKFFMMAELTIFTFQRSFNRSFEFILMMIFITTYDHTFVWFSLIFLWRHHIWGFLTGSVGLWVFVYGFSPTNKVPISLGCRHFDLFALFCELYLAISIALIGCQP